MSYMSIDAIRAEFARRAVQFHEGEKLEDIRLWGNFAWGAVSRYVKDGRVVPNPGYGRENKTIWCRPSAAETELVRALIAKHSLDELSAMAGWR